MKRMSRKPGATRKATARKMQLGVMAIAMGVTCSAIAHAGPKAASKTTASKATQVGMASWYGGKFNGRKTASGERFDMNALTCAHRSLPLGSWIRVTNLLNLKQVFLRVNDRGPVPRSRVLDLSRAAARMLGIGGLGQVKIEPIRTGDTQMTDPAVQAAVLQMLQAASTSAYIQVRPTLLADR
jgi:rare lipoprotein A